MIGISVPASNRCVAKLWRSVCTVTRLAKPAAFYAERQAACTTCESIGRFSSRPGNSHWPGFTRRQ